MVSEKGRLWKETITKYCNFLLAYLCLCSLPLTFVIIHVIKPSTSAFPISHTFLLSFDCNILVVTEHLFL